MSSQCFTSRSWMLLMLCCSFLFFGTVLGNLGAQAANTCQPATWKARMAQRTARAAEPSGTAPAPFVHRSAITNPDDPVEPGQVVCRYFGTTDDTVNYYSCTEMAEFYSISLDLFFQLNPDLKADCSNIQPSTQYCVRGYIQPVISSDGFCGPQHNNATCDLTDLPCCNSETWKCGNSTADCAPGTCWNGQCLGHTIYSTDGKCGPQNGNVLCAGKWGDCCSFDGQCGTGDDFCGSGKCQSGNCTTPGKPPVVDPDPAPSFNTTNVSPDGSCGPAHGYVCGAPWGNCCNNSNVCGSQDQDCSSLLGCQSQYGLCSGSSNANATNPSTTQLSSSSTLSSFTAATSTQATPQERMVRRRHLLALD